MTNATTLTGLEAIEYAEANGLMLNKYQGPIEGAREGLTVAEAREIAAEDASLVWVTPITERGKADGAEAVDTYYNEDLEGLTTAKQIAKLEATIAPGAESWDTAAINAGAFGGPAELKSEYYAAYELGARERVAELVKELSEV